MTQNPKVIPFAVVTDKNNIPVYCTFCGLPIAIKLKNPPKIDEIEVAIGRTRIKYTNDQLKEMVGERRVQCSYCGKIWEGNAQYHPSDYWGPEDTIRIHRYPSEYDPALFIPNGDGPYLSLIPIIDTWKMQDCDCGYGHERLLDTMDHVIIVRSYYGCDDGYDGSVDMIVKCPQCGKVWRDVS